MTDHKYILEKYKGMKTRYRCPECNDTEKTFSRYVNTETEEYLADHVGRCNRETSCSYHYKPGQFFQDNGHNKPELLALYTRTREANYVTPQQKPASYIDIEVFKKSLTGYQDNNFVQFLTSTFGEEVAGKLVKDYHIGTSKHWPGSVVFWQVDTRGRIRTGKIMAYNPETGKRVKEPFNHVTWVHSVLKSNEFELKQCLFGSHLLTIESQKPVAIVESEKTAIISSVYLPQFIWMASGSLSNLNAEKCAIFKNRIVFLFPDLNGFEKWTAKARELTYAVSGSRFIVSDLLETKATEEEKVKGLDLADYLVRFEWQTFGKTKATNKPEIRPVINGQYRDEDIPQATSSRIEFQEKTPSVLELTPIETSSGDLWDIKTVEDYFKSITPPSGEFQISQGVKSCDLKKTISSHLEAVKAQNGKRAYKSLYDTLITIKNKLSSAA